MTTFHSQVTRAILEFAKPWVLVDYSRRQAEWYDQTYNLPVAQALETRVAMSKSLAKVSLRSSFLIPGVTTPGVAALLHLSIPSHELKLMGYSLVAFSLALQLTLRWWDKRNYRLLSDEFILRTDNPEAARQDRANFEASVYKKCGRALSRLYRWTRGVR